MKKLNSTACKVLVCAALVAAGGLCLALPPAFSSQEDMTHVRSDALGPLTRPMAVFAHDQHNEKAGIDDCAACHHGKDAQGRQDKEDISAGIPCADCHAGAEKQVTPLMRAYHQQCIGCHTQMAKGPTHCAGCHVK